jgi:ATP phosphoribosyltransferase regulatory subunit HisZ
MTPAILISLAGVLCAIGVSMLGVVWRLGTRTGEMTLKIAAFEDALRRADDLAEKWNKQVIDAVRELDGRITEQNVKIGELENKWKTAHRLVSKVSEIEADLAGIKAVCRDRIRCEVSTPLFMEDGAPGLQNGKEDDNE